MKPVIQAENLGRVFDNGTVRVEALKEVNFTIGTGELVAITGSSGSGKSTLLGILGCLDRPTSGKYILDGVAVAGMQNRELAALRNRKIGFVFQSFQLLQRTSALDNVELPMLYNPSIPEGSRKKLAMEALDRMGLSDRALHKPSELSGGQQQRVAIARALVSNPKLILADEPTGNLDSESTASVMEILSGLNKSGTTVVIVTHEPDVAARCRRVISLRDGHIITDQVQESKIFADAIRVT